jgi:hypothetical protein
MASASSAFLKVQVLPYSNLSPAPKSTLTSLQLPDVELAAEAAGHFDLRAVGRGEGHRTVAVRGLKEAGILADLDEGDLNLGVDLLRHQAYQPR